MNPRLPRQHRTTRRSATIASTLALAAAVSLSGCQWTSKIITDKQYDPADGVSVTVGDVQLRNMLIVSGQAGGPGTMVGWAHNNGSQPVTVTFSAGAGQQLSLPLPAGADAALGSGGSSAALRSVAAAPGMLADVTVSTPSGGAVAARVPVLYPYDGSPYRSLAPAGFQPRTPAPEATAPMGTASPGAAEGH